MLSRPARPKSELNFPIGEKVDLDFTKEGERWKLPIVLIDIILFAASRALQCSVKSAEERAALMAKFVREEIPLRMQLADRSRDSTRLMEQLVRKMVEGFDTQALQREPHMVLLRDEFCEELKPLLSQWMLHYLRSIQVAIPTFQSLNPGRHVKSRGPHPLYPARADVPDESVEWDVPWEGYAPVEFLHEVVTANSRELSTGQGWADPGEPERELIEQRGSYEIRKVPPHRWAFRDGRPLNPRGRTGLSNRGLLGKWGANHAADPIVTRFSPRDGRLEVIVIQRQDTGEWALPGGMVEPFEVVSETLLREFTEEAASSVTPEELEQLKGDLFSDANRKEVCRMNAGWPLMAPDCIPRLRRQTARKPTARPPAMTRWPLMALRALDEP